MSQRSGSRPQRSGEITVIAGSMFAGKTEELIRLARRALYARRRVQVFKPAIDNRYDEHKVVTHMGVSHNAVVVNGVAELTRMILPETETICIEECQFFDHSLVNLVQKLADEGRDVILAGLDQDFRREPFGCMPALLAVADNVVKLRAICMNCGAPASHTYRMIEGKPAHYDDPVILIGATEAYEARCRACFKLKGGPKRAAK